MLLSAHTRLRYPHPVRQARNDFLILAGGDSIQQDLQHALLHTRSVLQGHVGWDHHFFASSTSPTTQPWPLDRQLAFAQIHASDLHPSAHLVPPWVGAVRLPPDCCSAVALYPFSTLRIIAA
jgi:hypothetical protein